MNAQEASKPRLQGSWLTSCSNANMFKALGSIPNVLTNKTKLLDPRLDPGSGQVGSRLCVSTMSLGAVAAEGPKTLLRPLSPRHLLRTLLLLQDLLKQQTLISAVRMSL